MPVFCILQTIVSVRVVFMKIGVIDTIHERWNGEVLVQSKWTEPDLNDRHVVGYKST